MNSDTSAGVKDYFLLWRVARARSYLSGDQNSQLDKLGVVAFDWPDLRCLLLVAVEYQRKMF